MGQLQMFSKSSTPLLLNSSVRWLAFQKFSKLQDDKNKLKLFPLQEPKCLAELSVPHFAASPSLRPRYQ